MPRGYATPRYRLLNVERVLRELATRGAAQEEASACAQAVRSRAAALPRVRERRARALCLFARYTEYYMLFSAAYAMTLCLRDVL